jgi:hypothetical protein
VSLKKTKNSVNFLKINLKNSKQKIETIPKTTENKIDITKNKMKKFQEFTKKIVQKMNRKITVYFIIFDKNKSKKFTNNEEKYKTLLEELFFI